MYFRLNIKAQANLLKKMIRKNFNYFVLNDIQNIYNNVIYFQGLVLEVNLLRDLNHPNIVKFFHHIVDQRSAMLYIIMEYCPGGDLKRLINRCKETSTFLEESYIWKILQQVFFVYKI